MLPPKQRSAALTSHPRCIMEVTGSALQIWKLVREPPGRIKSGVYVLPVQRCLRLSFRTAFTGTKRGTLEVVTSRGHVFKVGMPALGCNPLRRRGRRVGAVP